VPWGKPDPAEASRERLDFDDLYRKYVDHVARWSARLGGVDSEVDDVVQEVFVAVHRQLPKFRGDCQVSTWLYRITVNQIAERRRRDRWRRWLGGSAAEVAGHLPSPGLTPVEALERREVSARVYRALDRLNERYRTLVILFEIERLPGQEIAELMGMSLDSVWVSLHRARAQFVRQLGREEEDLDPKRS
jgi:RNA polymerase sigma-70 factor (ECF subfamily)